jgi:hypothetical protein
MQLSHKNVHSTQLLQPSCNKKQRAHLADTCRMSRSTFFESLRGSSHDVTAAGLLLVVKRREGVLLSTLALGHWA